MNPDLPRTWAEVPFGELNLFTSNTVDPDEFPQETFELYSVPSFPTGQPEILAGTSIGSTKQSVEPDDVLVCKINPRINRVWQVGQTQQNRQIASSEWIGFRCAPLDPRFFRYFFSSPNFRELICTDVTGVGGSLTRAQPKKVATFPVPVAPLSEQTRITDKLDAVLTRVDACRERLGSIPAILKRFRQSVLAAATSGELTEDCREGNRENDWKSSQISSCGTVSGGLTKNAKRQSLDLVKRYLRVANVYANRLELSDVAEIGLTESEYAKTKLQSGDLLIVEGNGSLDQLGRVALWSDELDDCVHQNHLIRWRTSGPLPKFVLYWLLSPRGRTDLMNLASTTTGLHTLSISKVGAVPIDLPSLPEQAEIIRRVETLFAFAERLEARYTTARTQVEKLTPSLLAKAFRGELVPQDPNDEPANVLLERIASKRAATEVQSSRHQSTAGRKSTRAPKENAAVTKSRQDEDVQGKPYLAQHLRLLGGSASAEALFRVSELPVADFYKQLAWEVAQGHVKDGKTVLELADAA